MDNDFIDDFIEEYKNQPCLWQASSVDFKNRKKRQEAYYKLIEVAGRHGEHYNIERTKQKINNLRCAFRHQLKKYTESKNNKSGKEDTYCPKRRYFESLMFLLNEETPDKKQADMLKENIIKKDNIESDKNNTYTEAYTLPVIQQEKEDIQRDPTQQRSQTEEVVTTEAVRDNVMQIEVQCDDEVNILWPRPSDASHSNENVQVITPAHPVKEIEPHARPPSTSSHVSIHSSKSENAPKKVKVDCSATNFEKLLNIACSRINTSDTLEDDFSIFGKMVAYKLRSMDNQQALIAEKLITDILLEGQMKMLQYPIRVPYRQEGQAYVISGININGSTETHSGRDQQHSTPTIHYTTTSASQL